ncbi:universal stress protein [Arthrobacter sp. NQ7]|jgi:nucleotide-binding universal stress UspA family protein|uniref:universal stress protein n=1 Tax=Arthrobacter sp. NQ7 TaxID=3032303 RepID=UPI00240FE843|nr:universal stress protein [Arthrobacter sp. NQ7]MDJ0456655.1 universal stress protein [Arthrobacter sp. NQ7]
MSIAGAPIARIVVGVDGSEASVEALRQAQRLATPLGAKVQALACWEYPQMYSGYVMMGVEGFEEGARKVLDEAVAQAFGPGIPENVTATLVRSHPREALIDASRDADMIVVGRRGHGGFGGLLLGSVSSALVAHAHCPVLVVHSPETPPGGPSGS